MSQHYPSLLLTTGTHEAKWFKVEENKVEFLAEHLDEKAKFSDKESHMARGGIKSSQGGATDVFNVEKSEETRLHLVNAAAETAKLWQAGEYVHLMVSAPPELKNLVHEKLQSVLPKLEYKYISGNHTKDTTARLLELAKKSLEVV